MSKLNMVTYICYINVVKMTIIKVIEYCSHKKSSSRALRY